MTRTMLFACIAAAGLMAGGAQAATHHAAAETQNAGAYAQPSQPIAYSNINAYIKASPKQRGTRDWSLAAATGSSVNASAATPPPAAMPTPAPTTGAADSGMTSPAPAAMPAPETIAAPAPPGTTAAPDTATPPPAAAPQPQSPQ
jgi:hypothetical protein